MIEQRLFWLTIIYAVLVGVGYYVARMSRAVLDAGKAARQQMKK